MTDLPEDDKGAKIDIDIDIQLELTDISKGTFPLHMSIMAHRMRHWRWDDYQYLLRQVLKGANDTARNSDREDPNTKSRFNPASANTIIGLLRLVEQLAPEIEADDIAVIPIYSSRVSAIKELVARDLIRPKNIKVDTVDSFHGSERKYVIVDLVRPNEERDIGFMRDPRRVNVAISRGMVKTVVVGDLAMYEKDSVFMFNKFNKPLYNLAVGVRKNGNERIRPHLPLLLPPRSADAVL
ncbi:hypothetical protein H072_9711 [Dactylellina haptotyla CBS 200.50]|uniref:DNA2/NAM7 helicase-like C-terminal domain-containing protein n=1 Tax=Dactylellina haptotyla (strain CBS 200.50) TaxID=1284197 RepID=S8A1Z0_DACHA|nr:hypothetical protein H072_9711 [Dactylellina haptotyla CBS 200.50]